MIDVPKPDIRTEDDGLNLKNKIEELLLSIRNIEKQIDNANFERKKLIKEREKKIEEINDLDSKIDDLNKLRKKLLVKKRNLNYKLSKIKEDLELISND